MATARRTAPLRRRKGEGEGAVALAHAHNAHTTDFRFSSSPFTFAMIRLKITPLRVKVFTRSVCRRKVKKKTKAFTPNQLWNSKLQHMGEEVKAKIQNLLTRAHARKASAFRRFPIARSRASRRLEDRERGTRSFAPPSPLQRRPPRPFVVPCAVYRHTSRPCATWLATRPRLWSLRRKRCGSKKMTCVEYSALTGIRSNAGRLRAAPH